MPRRIPDVNSVFECLVRHQVKFVVIGGVAAAFHGAMVMTLDLDLVHERTQENAERLTEAFRELGAYYREHEDWKPTPNVGLLMGRGHHLLQTTDGSIDVLGFVTGDREYPELVAESEEFTIAEGVVVRVVSLEMLIRLKEELGRERDLSVLPVLRAALDERRQLD
jgi:predicted nucleotidyltransferase